MENNIFGKLKDLINSSSIEENYKNDLLKGLLELKEKQVNLLITGATGSGKSSTINALFETNIAKVGVGVDPETMTIQKYNLENLTLWDSPGLGDSKEQDIKHANGIKNLLKKRDKNGDLLIDIVLVILDGSSRDLGTSYDLINKIIIPNLGKNANKRVLIAINQADMAMKGRNWDYDNNEPEPKLVEFLEEKVKSVKERIRKDTNVDIEPIYYSAGYKEGDEEQKPWNLSKLLYFIVKNTPTEKRLAYVENISREKTTWKYDDRKNDYKEKINETFVETLNIVETYANTGGKIGKTIGGKTGEKIGKVIGGAIGGAVAMFKKIW